MNKIFAVYETKRGRKKKEKEATEINFGRISFF
jgi:hypothetical protein